jgi:dUTP pyrophosphatase
MSPAHESVEILFRRLSGNDLPLPARSTAQASGLDLRACLEEPITIQPGCRAMVPTGFAVALPEGWEAQIRPRSGLAIEWGLTMLNTPGTIDSDYRGEIKVLAVNHGERPVEIRRGDRIAQMVIARVPVVSVREVEHLSETARGEGGFGHTGSR